MNTTRSKPALRPLSEQERAERAAESAGTPNLDFTGEVPYDAYVHASTLHSLQQTLSDEPGEMSFLMISQVMELYFKLICFELLETRRLLRDDDAWRAIQPLHRAALHLTGLTASWQSLRWMTPTDFNRFRDLLGEGSGFQSAMYRHLEFLLGLKTASLVRPFKRQPEVHEELIETLEQPSVWDDTTALLARNGYAIPDEVLERDVTVEHEPHPAVEDAWVEIYRNDTPDNHLRLLGEALTEVAEQFNEWRHQHLRAVHRSMGAKAGSGGSDGIKWLERSLARVVFPELWSARTKM
ncbi:tryptophan 2,3-dioxygenase [Phytoactinopolyspora mesophila]|uniref:Tryptophan 2,3-dioxygenase n=1 Tax=Phytoactinopolyspora mesophila TaxID=2650750 RepID=A0A7K3M5G8_9ACTN|nr:tryptophan 2,3-dioxygenase family protein [Phytoactinopolyspora mesophila]NDL58277.1 tryptophan 2,3-dioxygenase [Phytoactinopolyspora mesophila]